MKEITLKINSVEVLLDKGPDIIFLHLDTNTTFPAMEYPPIAKIEAAPNYGVEWVKNTFNLAPKIINIRS